MSDSRKPSIYSDTMARFKAVLEDLPAHFKRAPGRQQEVLLNFLENWKYALRRKHVRKDCVIPVNFAVGDRAYTSLIRNIGAGGVFIEAANGMATGQLATLTFLLPTLPRPTKIGGEIVWKRPNGFGVKFKTTPYLEEHFEKAVATL